MKVAVLFVSQFFSARFLGCVCFFPACVIGFRLLLFSPWCHFPPCKSVSSLMRVHGPQPACLVRPPFEVTRSTITTNAGLPPALISFRSRQHLDRLVKGLCEGEYGGPAFLLVEILTPRGLVVPWLCGACVRALRVWMSEAGFPPLDDEFSEIPGNISDNFYIFLSHIVWPAPIDSVVSSGGRRQKLNARNAKTSKRVWRSYLWRIYQKVSHRPSWCP